MTKLKLKNLSAVGNVLTSEELKRVYGGNGNGESSNTESCGTCRCFVSFFFGSDHMFNLGDVGNRGSCLEACKQMCKEKQGRTYTITCY